MRYDLFKQKELYRALPEDERPSYRTVRRWVENGHQPGPAMDRVVLGVLGASHLATEPLATKADIERIAKEVKEELIEELTAPDSPAVKALVLQIVESAKAEITPPPPHTAAVAPDSVDPTDGDT